MRRESKRQNVAEDPDSIRLDLFLRQSRLIPRRTLAQHVCQHGGIRVNGLVAKAGRAIKTGDLIEWDQPHKRVQVRVLKVPESAPSKSEASALFEVI
jgi:ribosomal 50S subunit-recycling heat shock protein